MLVLSGGGVPGAVLIIGPQGRAVLAAGRVCVYVCVGVGGRGGVGSCV